MRVLSAIGGWDLSAGVPRRSVLGPLPATVVRYACYLAIVISQQIRPNGQRVVGYKGIGRSGLQGEESVYQVAEGERDPRSQNR